MTKILRGAVAALFWAIVATPAAMGGVLTGRVVSVHDGDTVTVLDADRTQHKIRLSGIDAPELHQAHGRVSREHLAGQVAGKTVQVEWFKHDKYQRIVGKIFLDGKDINLTQITSGLAWHYKKYSSEQAADDRSRYGKAEVAARESRLGLWQEPEPMPPWDYRRTKSSR